MLRLTGAAAAAVVSEDINLANVNKAKDRKSLRCQNFELDYRSDFTSGTIHFFEIGWLEIGIVVAAAAKAPKQICSEMDHKNDDSDYEHAYQRSTTFTPEKVRQSKSHRPALFFSSSSTYCRALLRLTALLLPYLLLLDIALYLHISTTYLLISPPLPPEQHQKLQKRESTVLIPPEFTTFLFVASKVANWTLLASTVGLLALLAWKLFKRRRRRRGAAQKMRKDDFRLISVLVLEAELMKMQKREDNNNNSNNNTVNLETAANVEAESTTEEVTTL